MIPGPEIFQSILGAREMTVDRLPKQSKCVGRLPDFRALGHKAETTPASSRVDSEETLERMRT